MAIASVVSMANGGARKDEMLEEFIGRTVDSMYG